MRVSRRTMMGSLGTLPHSGPGAYWQPSNSLALRARRCSSATSSRLPAAHSRNGILFEDVAASREPSEHGPSAALEPPTRLRHTARTTTEEDTMASNPSAPKQITWIICLVLYAIALMSHFGVISPGGDVATWSWILGFGLLLIAVQVRGL